MLRHHYIADNDKLMALADLLQDFLERDRESGACREEDGADNSLW